MRLLDIVLNQQKSKDGVGYYYYEGYGPPANRESAPAPGAMHVPSNRTTVGTRAFGDGPRHE